jgi:cytochrome b subunit of formate dehydrogenase
MTRRTIKDIEKIWSNVEGVKKLSDRVVGIGPFGIGLDGLLAWIPVVNQVYTVGAGGWLILQALRARASPSTLAQMAAYIGLDTATDAVPIAGYAVDTLFPGHLLAAKALQKDISMTHWVEGSESEARASGEHERHLETVRGDRKLRRVVYLHD